MKSNETEDKCHYCRNICKPLRCSQCKITKYCSKSCQKKDWKSSHRLQCRNQSSGISRDQNPSINSPVNRPFKNFVNENDVKKAASELIGLMSNISVQDASENFHKASDEITRMRFKKDDDEDDNEDDDEDNDEGIGSSKQDRIPIPRKNDLNLDVSNSTRDSSNNNIIQNISEAKFQVNVNDGQGLPVPQQRQQPQNEPAQDDLQFTSLQDDSVNTDEGDCCWNYAIEKLIYISTFSVTVVPPNKDSESICEQNLQVVLSTGKSHSGTRRECIQPIVQINHKISQNEMKIIATFKLPCAIVSTNEEIQSSLRVDDTTHVISLRIQYHDAGQAQIDNIIPESTPLTPIHALNNLQCKSCQQYLLLKPRMQGSKARMDDGIDAEREGQDRASIIRNAFHLPTGHWDEITDYLTCWDGVSIHTVIPLNPTLVHFDLQPFPDHPHIQY